jgi:hypothetical protein
MGDVFVNVGFIVEMISVGVCQSRFWALHCPAVAFDLEIRVDWGFLGTFVGLVPQCLVVAPMTSAVGVVSAWEDH